MRNLSSRFLSFSLLLFIFKLNVNFPSLLKYRDFFKSAVEWFKIFKKTMYISNSTNDSVNGNRKKKLCNAIWVCHVTIDHPLPYGNKIDLSY